MWHRTIDCLGVAIRVTSQLSAPVSALEALLRTYADASGPAEMAYELARARWPRVLRDGSIVTQAEDELDLVAILERDLYTEVMARARGLLVHAGAVIGNRGGAIVLAGRSGAGKSTLVRSLLAHGFRYLTEECVAFVGERRCRGLTRSMQVDDPRILLPPGFTSDDYSINRLEGVLRTRLFHPPAHAVWHGEAPVSGLLLIDHAPDADNVLVPISGGVALLALWPLVFRQDPSAIDDAARGLASVPAYRLCSSSPEEAVSRVRSLAEELGVGL